MTHSALRGASVALVVLVVAGCGGAMAVDEYIEATNALVERASERGAALLAAAAATEDLTPQDLQAGLQAGTAIRVELQEGADDLVPPRGLAELHDVMWEWHGRFIEVEQDLASRAGTAEDTIEGWTALSDSPEMAAYREALADGVAVCDGLQARLDRIADRGDFADTPWVPTAMGSAVEAVLGCAWFPEDPENVYRFPP